jgi:carboxyl-terminal processing protease
MNLTETDRRKILSQINCSVLEKFYDPNFKGQDWPSLLAGHEEAIIKESDQTAFEAKINQLLGNLRTSGLGLISNATKISAKNAISATLHDCSTKFGRRWVFQDVHAGGPAAQAGVESGDILLSVEGVELTPPEKPVFAMDRGHEVLLEKTSGPSRVTITTPAVKHSENPCAVPDRVKARIDDGVAIAKIPLFQGKLGIDFAKQVTDVFDSTLLKADRLVLDLRGNPGGGLGCLRVMSVLTAEKRPVGFSTDRATTLRGYDRDKLPRFDSIPRSKLGVPWLAVRFAGKKSVVLVTEGLGKRAFHNRIAVLVNEHTTCASEMVALFAREELGASIIGRTTPGRLVSHTGIKLGHGLTLALPIAAYVSWGGTRLDGTGLRPDVEVDWSDVGARQGIDVQLNSAVNITKAM